VEDDTAHRLSLAAAGEMNRGPLPYNKSPYLKAMSNKPWTRHCMLNCPLCRMTNHVSLEVEFGGIKKGPCPQDKLCRFSEYNISATVVAK